MRCAAICPDVVEGVPDIETERRGKVEDGGTERGDERGGMARKRTEKGE